jgi:Tfp pilus assembly protein PilZ
MQDRYGERREGGWKAFYERQDGGGYLNPVDDLSVSGSFLRTSRPLQPGARLELLLVSPDERRWVQMPAEVVWSGRKRRHRGMGVRFLHAQGSERAVRDLVAREAG